MALAAVLLYPIGIPCVFYFCTSQHANVTADRTPLSEARETDPEAKAALHGDPVILEQLGFLYARFKPDFW
jgi:hypothetical protein